MFEFKPDYEEARKRIEAWWDCEVIDRALTLIAFSKPENERVPFPAKRHATLRERWFDTDFNADCAFAAAANTIYYADALPIQHPNLGPEVFSAFYGCDLEFSEGTSWSVPILEDWDSEAVARLRLDANNVYYRKIMEMTDAYLERADGRFIVGYTDLHVGGDAIAAFRDPQALCLDVLERPDEVRALCERITDDFLALYDRYYEKLSAAGMPSTTWLNLTCDGKYHVPSNDFSCMISDKTFEDVFLPGIERECAHMDRNIYHLDGPGALRFLDRLMDVPKMYAIQWVPGAGHDDWHDWIRVYQRIQARRRAFQVWLPAKDLDEFFTHLRPEGACLCVGGISNQEEADAVLRKIARWGRR
ncbi:MAG TPA: hypothetical protein VM492_03120 [Sumerlaeia bacterium]|nr:hypothetical protein [Sumerlaeia bacterium]